MASNDVEMEDAQMPDPGNGIKESEDKVLDFDIGLKGNDLLSAVAVSGNADKSENGNGSDDKLSNEANDQIIAMCELENQTHHEKDTSEPMSIEPVEARGERVDTISIDEEEISTEANPKVQTDSGILVQKLSDAKADTESKNEDEISTKANAEVLTVSGIIVQKLTEATSKIVENSDVNDKLKVEDPVKNGLECENPVEKNVLGDSIDENPVENLVGDSGGDVAVKKTRGSEEDDNCAKNVAKIDMTNGNSDSGRDTREDMKLETGLSSNEAPQVQNITLDDVSQSGDKQMEDGANANEVKTVNDESKQQVPEIVVATPVTDGNTKTVETVTKLEVNDSSQLNQHEVAASNSFSRYLPANLGSHSEETEKTIYSPSMIPLVGESDDGTSEDQAAFIRELENFYRERAMDFKPPKFYGQPLNCLKLWRAVIRLGGYDRVTGSKLWRQVGESFHPPKTCTTVSWTFRIFYEKSLLEYERHKRISGDLQLPTVFPEASGATVDIEGNSYQGSGSGRARRDAAARAMQGWHVQRQGDYGEAGEPVTKDKNISNMSKREKNIKSIASLKQKRPNEVEHPVKAARSEASKQLATSVVDIGPPADWVKINVLQTKECFEVYALIPGLLRNEVRVQSDPVGRLVITGQPEQLDNPWGITPFKKVVSLPARIDPLQTSAVVSHHGRLLVRVPFESNS